MSAACYDVIVIRRYLPSSTEGLIRWYERYISPVSLLVGFSIDAVASQALDLWHYSFVLLAYLVLAGVSILVLHLIETGRIRIFDTIAQFMPVIIQFAFGGLFSGFIILYSKSASFAASWMFVVILAALLLGNERFRRIYVTFPVQIGIFFFAIYSFSIFYVPVLASSVGNGLFVVSGVASVVVIAAYLVACSFLIPGRFKETRTLTVRVVLGTFVLINALYVVNAIPPLPLALKDAGVFHSVARVSGEYVVTFEPREWYEVYLRYHTEFHRVKGETAYVYTAVFAPDGISTGLQHEWQHYDDALQTWVTKDTISFSIAGGRSGGYRGYTLHRNPEEGYWRVNVLTSYGKLIGRVAFRVIEAEETPVLESGVR